MARLSNLRWIVAGLLCLVTIINYVDRQTLSVIAPVISKEFHMSDQEYSYVTTSFQLAYMVGQALAGAALDVVGVRMGFVLILVLWSIATICHRFATGWMSFAFWRVMLGLGEAGNWPAAIKVISEWFPESERAFATGIFNFGSGTGAFLAPLVIVPMVQAYGWRNSFVLAGGLGMLWLIAWLAVPWSKKPVLEDEAKPAAQKLPWLQLLEYRQVWGMILARFLADPVWWFYIFWLPKYLVDKRGFSLAEMALGASLPFLTADLGCLIGGGASSYLIARGWNVDRARKTVMVASALLMPAALFVVTAQSGVVAVSLISLATFAHQSWSTNMLTLPADLFPPRVVASVSGLTGVGASAGGFLTQLMIGYVVSRFSYGPVFTAAGLLHPTAALILIFVVGKIQQNEI